MDAEVAWYDYGQTYIFVDGSTYRHRRELLTRIHNCRMLPLGQSRNLVASLPYRAPHVLERLRVAFGLSRPERDAEHGVARKLVALLGSAGADLAGSPDAFARFYIFEPEPPKPTPVAFPEPFNGYKPAPLSATSSWVTIECVDDGDPPRPVPGVQLQLVTASTEVRTTRTDDKGVAFVDGIAPGRVTLQVQNLDGALWRPLEGDEAKPSPADEHFTWHEVKQGECLSKIAHQYGFKYWQDIWKFRLNKDLREKRKSPHVLHPGDMLAVPAVALYEIVRDTEQTHPLEVKRAGEVHLRLCLNDFNGVPFGHEDYELLVHPERQPRRGRTDAEGVLEARVPVTTERVYVHCAGLQVAWRFALSALNPLDGGGPVPIAGAEDVSMPAHASVSGLQARLNALGYDATPVSEHWTAQTAAALAWFQVSELGEAKTDGWDEELDAALRERGGA